MLGYNPVHLLLKKEGKKIIIRVYKQGISSKIKIP